MCYLKYLDFLSIPVVCVGSKRVSVFLSTNLVACVEISSCFFSRRLFRFLLSGSKHTLTLLSHIRKNYFKKGNLEFKSRMWLLG